MWKLKSTKKVRASQRLNALRRIAEERLEWNRVNSETEILKFLQDRLDDTKYEEICYVLQGLDIEGLREMVNNLFDYIDKGLVNKSGHAYTDSILDECISIINN